MTMFIGFVNHIIEKAHEEALPITITTGRQRTDCNGDMQVDVLIEYAESDKWIVAKFMNEAMEEFDR
jgi:hypothetical protein